MLCIHCKKYRQWKGRRGLCPKCYLDRSIRDLYPSSHAGYNQYSSHEPTEEELEKMILENYPTMPRGHNAQDDPEDSIDNLGR